MVLNVHNLFLVTRGRDPESPLRSVATSSVLPLLGRRALGLFRLLLLGERRGEPRWSFTPGTWVNQTDSELIQCH